MSFELPSVDEIKQMSTGFGLALDDREAERLLGFLQGFGHGYAELDETADELPAVQYPERSYHYPTAAENSLGAWYVRSTIQGAAGGPLQGRSVAVKDNIFVAGVPMMNGAAFLEGFIPDMDATVVTRLLDAGASITGKAVCEYLCVSGGSATAGSGIVQNPRRPGYSTGGSSSGSAALVAGGAADMALGCDQAGSIRIPSSWTGIYGMKATHGLVPYSGIMGMESSIDNVGPMTANVADNALMLEVIAGDDGIDARQRNIRVARYTEALDGGVAGMRIGIVEEGFGQGDSEAAVDDCVRAAAARLGELGAEVSRVSVPAHLQGLAIWGGIVADGLWHTLRLNGYGLNQAGHYSPAQFAAMDGWLGDLRQAPVNVKLLLLLGKHLERYRGRYYGKAKNLAFKLRAAYDAALGDQDLLLMPTTRMRSKPNPASLDEAPDEQIVDLAFANITNTCQFDVTGHPAMSIPCGLRDDLPVGMMLVGRHFEESSIYRAAHAFEQSGQWEAM